MRGRRVVDKLEFLAWIKLLFLILIAVALLLFIIFAVVPPLSPDTGTVALSDAVVVNKTTVERLNTEREYLDEQATGSYEGHTWPDSIPEDEPVILHVAVDRPGYQVMRTRTHEMWHFKLENAGRAPVTHHHLMEERGILPIRPWDWELQCFKLFR